MLLEVDVAVGKGKPARSGVGPLWANGVSSRCPRCFVPAWRTLRRLGPARFSTCFVGDGKGGVLFLHEASGRGVSCQWLRLSLAAFKLGPWWCTASRDGPGMARMLRTNRADAVSAGISERLRSCGAPAAR